MADQRRIDMIWVEMRALPLEGEAWDSSKHMSRFVTTGGAAQVYALLNDEGTLGAFLRPLMPEGAGPDNYHRIEEDAQKYAVLTGTALTADVRVELGELMAQLRGAVDKVIAEVGVIEKKIAAAECRLRGLNG